MSNVFTEGFATLEGRRYGVVEFTPGELRAVFVAMNAFVHAASPQEAREVFGSAAGVRAAERAQSKIAACGHALGALQ